MFLIIKIFLIVMAIQLIVDAFLIRKISKQNAFLIEQNRLLKKQLKELWEEVEADE